MNASPTISNSIFITGYSIHFIQKKGFKSDENFKRMG